MQWTDTAWADERRRTPDSDRQWDDDVLGFALPVPCHVRYIDQEGVTHETYVGDYNAHLGRCACCADFYEWDIVAYRELGRDTHGLIREQRRQRDLAALMDVDPPAYSDWDRDRQDERDAVRVSRNLSIAVQTLLKSLAQIADELGHGHKQLD